ncbi:hypothetical protein SS50377_27150 [Spironucleus salmonicida]|uniref:Uncharacterized protein n=1 Tax=Spironucleus salmonicida TaxID=348837 RepID=A0A9P8RVJ0_9EUKA|nr:hypothetical protein SS50377_27150 [Spironucleus salmonicida]
MNLMERTREGFRQVYIKYQFYCKNKKRISGREKSVEHINESADIFRYRIEIAQYILFNTAVWLARRICGVSRLEASQGALVWQFGRMQQLAGKLQHCRLIWKNGSFKAGGAQFNAAQIKLLRSILSACQPCRAPKIRQMEYFRRILVIQTFPDVEIKQVCKELIKLRQIINSILYQTSICCIGTISLSITSIKLPIIQPQLASKSASKYSLD